MSRCSFACSSSLRKLIAGSEPRSLCDVVESSAPSFASSALNPLRTLSNREVPTVSAPYAALAVTSWTGAICANWPETDSAMTMLLLSIPRVCDSM